MDPVTIALISAAAFGTVVALVAFIRQIIISRDKNLNDEAQRKALTQEAEELEKMREQMQSGKRFDTHYKVLGANKDAIVYLDAKIEDILAKKAKLVERFSQVALKESGAIVDGESTKERKKTVDRLKEEIEVEMKFYDGELVHLQDRRSALWDTHSELQEYLVAQEKTRNENLDALYKRHSGTLEKVYMRHIEDSEHIAKQSIEAGTSTFKSMILAPIQFLLQYFNLSSSISLDRAQLEKAARDQIDDLEKEVNDTDTTNDTKTDDDVNSDTEDDTNSQDDGTNDDAESDKDQKWAIA
jgi:hypothetical protein